MTGSNPIGEMPGATMLVTGAAGFIGSNLCERLLRDGYEVVGIDNFNDYYDPARKRANVSNLSQHDRFTLYEADLCDQQAMNRIISEHGPAAIAHLGAYGGVRYSIGRAKLYTDVNIVGSVNVLEAAREHGVGQFVFASTSSVYGKTDRLPFTEDDPCNHPLAPYPASKKAIEAMGYSYHNLHGMNFTAVRFFSVYGPRGRMDMMPYMTLDSVVHGKTIKLFDAGQMQRDWTYVDDIVDGVVRAMVTPLGYGILNLGRGEPVLMAEFVRIIERLVGRSAKLETPAAPASEPKITFADIGRARDRLGYDPQTSIFDGLSRMWDWYRSEIVG